MKRVSILGSTGSIGTQTLEVIARHPERFQVVGLAAGKHIELLREQSARFGVATVASAEDGAAGLLRVAVDAKPDVVVAATVGFVAFEAVFAAVERGIDVAVANKELVVAAGDVLLESARSSGSRILPVDSEHSAIFQCLQGEDPARVRAIVLTASGGPFRNTSKEAMAEVTVAQALAHPTWRMGAKNTIDSATLMNKGLEVIEASRLFGIGPDRIAVVVHPQSIVHGLVAFTDGSIKAQLGAPDMRIPIGYALAFPERLEDAGTPFVGMDALGVNGATLRYDFEPVDFEKFPCLGLAYRALQAGAAMPAILSAANETAVDSFIAGDLSFDRISGVLERVMGEVDGADGTLQGILDADRRARETARAVIARAAHAEGVG